MATVVGENIPGMKMKQCQIEKVEMDLMRVRLVWESIWGGTTLSP